MTLPPPASRHEKTALALLLLTAPLVAYALTLLRPTFDDWTYTTYPNTDPDFWKYLLPYGNYWRPFDGLFGYVVALHRSLFPALNQLCILTGHIIATLLVWLVARQLRFHPAARLTAATLHYVSPAVLGTVLTNDTLNQTYAACWGLAALWVYLRRGRHSVPLWMALCAVATLCKENGIMWLFICPLTAWAFGQRTRHEALRHAAWGLLFCAVYGAVRLSLPNTYHKEDNEYLAASLGEKARNVVKYVLFSFTSMDFVSVLHRPSRHLPFLLLTLALSAPLFVLNLLGACRHRHSRQVWSLLLASLLAVLPHLLTLFSTIHSYAGLAPLALLAGWLVPAQGKGKTLAATAFGLYVLSAVAVDARHWQKAHQSGLVGYRMALATMAQTHRPTHRVCCICVDRDEPKYSSFCVIPYDAYGWGNAVIWETGGQWPQVLDVEKITPEDGIAATARKKLRQGYDHVWIADGENIQVMERQTTPCRVGL